jgi:putative ABC transport system substrate-binding protein
LRLLIWLAFGLANSQSLPNALCADETVPRAARVGILTLASASPIAPARDAFLGQLRRYGYIEGQNLHIELRWADGDLGRLRGLANDLVQHKVDVIVAGSTYDTQAAKKATRTIPIVMVTSADPVATGLVSDLSRPDGNVTGLSLMTIELATKRLQILKDGLPRLGRIAVLWNPDHPFHEKVVEGIRRAAPSMSIQPVFVSARELDQLPLALAEAKRARAEALCVIEDPFFYRTRATIAKLALKEKLPTIFAERAYAEAGGVLSYGPNYEHMWRRAADYVHKILDGAKPRELPIEQPTKFELVINMKTVKELDLKLQESLLLQATEVIK